MHLMALHAFWHMPSVRTCLTRSCRLNAPYGAPCFLTEELERLNRAAFPSLNAPYGAPCFLTFTRRVDGVLRNVS